MQSLLSVRFMLKLINRNWVTFCPRGTTNGHADHGHTHSFSCNQGQFSTSGGQVNQPLVILATSSCPNGDLGLYSHQHLRHHHLNDCQNHSHSHGHYDHHKHGRVILEGNNYHIQPCVHLDTFDVERTISDSRTAPDHLHSSHPHQQVPNHGLYRSNSSEFISQARPLSFSLGLTPGSRLGKSSRVTEWTSDNTSRFLVGTYINLSYIKPLCLQLLHLSSCLACRFFFFPFSFFFFFSSFSHLHLLLDSCLAVCLHASSINK